MKTTCIALLAAGIAIAGCKKPQQEGKKDKSEVLAKVGDVVITVEDFENTINSYSPYLRQKYNSPDQRKRKLDEMVEFELLALEAKNLGYTKDPTIQEALKQQLVRELQEEIFKEIRLEDITDEEAKAYFDAHPEKYHKPAQVRVAHLVVSDRTRAEALLKELLADELNSVKWREAVNQYSEDDTNKLHGGDMGYISKVEERTPGEPEVPDAIAVAAWEIKEVGKIYPKAVEVEGKFHLVKLTSTRPPIDRTFEQVRRQIQSILWKEKREKAQTDFIEALKKSTKIEVDYDLLDQVKIPEAPAGMELPIEPPPEEGGAAQAPVIPTKGG